MYGKRGQITVFIIVGLLILISAGMYLLVQMGILEEELAMEQFSVFSGTQVGGQVQTFVEKCVRKTGENALVFIGEHGGYYQLPVVYELDMKLPYYFFRNKSKFISKKEMEKQLGMYMDKELSFCVQNFGNFIGHKITSDKPKTTVKIQKDQVAFKVKYPITVVKGTISKQLNYFEVKIKSRLFTIHDLINKFMIDQVQNPGSVCLSCLTKLAIKNNLRVELGPAGNLTLFTIIDEKVKIKKKDYEFEFVNHYG